MMCAAIGFDDIDSAGTWTHGCKTDGIVSLKRHNNLGQKLVPGPGYFFPGIRIISRNSVTRFKLADAVQQ